MAGLPVSLRRAPLGGAISAFALALAGVAVTVTAASPAMAQRRQQQSANSEAFAKAYKPVADAVNAGMTDYGPVKAQLPAVVAAVETPTDRFMAGSLVLLVGSNSEDRVLQRQGLELMLASGQVAADRVGQYQFFVGNLAFDAKDFPAAQTALEAARSIGYQDPNLDGLIAESYFLNRQFDTGFARLKGAILANQARGAAVPELWYQRGLTVAYDNKLAGPTEEWATMLVSQFPTAKNWAAAVQVVGEPYADDAPYKLDLMRLLSLAGAMTDRRDFITYIEAADPRIMSNEVGKVLAAAVAAGVITESEEYYKEVKRIADERMADDRRDAPQLAREAQQSPTGRAAMNAGDVFYSIEDFAQAEAMYKLAVEKGGTGVDRDRALTRLGIAQARQDKAADAKATFDQVTGNRASLAKLWEAYLAGKA